MKNILIALDYNPTAQKIAETGAALAKAMNAKITLLHITAEPAYYSTPEYSPIMGFSGFNIIDAPNSRIELNKLAEDFLKSSKQHLNDESIKTIVEEGDSAETILQTAKKISADIIVMGSHSQRWLEKILIGSVTKEVLNKTTVPLFIVPTRE